VEEIVKVIHQKYFYSKRMNRNRDPEFLERINGVFICFVATIIRHCLKMWRSGEYLDDGPDFKYETACRKCTQVLWQSGIDNLHRMKAKRSRLIQQAVADLGQQQTSDSGPPGEQHQSRSSTSDCGQCEDC